MTLTDHGTDTARSAESIPDVVARLRSTFRTGRTRPLEWRFGQLEALERMLVEREKDFVAAIVADLGRNEVDAWLADIAPVVAESKYARKHLRSWTKPQRTKVPLAALPGKAWVQWEPLGVAGIIGPWNYPVFLLLSPLVGSIAAGNVAVIKPSEHTPNVSALLAQLLPEYLDADTVAVVEGAAAETLELIDQKLDHCFFTGGLEIGKHIMTAAAKHLTPVTLELGGKSPVIVADDASVKVAARRIAYAKSLNSGQTCIAPDYVLVDRRVRDEFVTALQTAIDTFKIDTPMPLVHERRAGRIKELIAGAGGQVVRGGAVDAAARTAELTVIVDPDKTSDLMTEEIFGPVLPVVTVDSFDEAVATVNAGEKPLAVYLFSNSRDKENRVLAEISNGGTVINHLVFQVIAPGLPFGGVGNSGMGAYHGRWGFETFSHRKAVLRKPTRPDPNLLYPPYNKLKERLLRTVF
ncbi:MAG TPA: aldehyde dehydrogenase family protein [Jatrophihabitans sp.]|jgi:aldehyde dehydrogenase (NAD+)